MAGTIPLSMTQQLDQFGKPLAGGRLYIIQAGTVNTLQNAYQDSGLTKTWPNPIILDSAGRIPPFFLADGSIKIRLEDASGNPQVVADGVLVIGPSGGSSGGGSQVDATTLIQTGMIAVFYGTGVVTGFVRPNAKTIGNAASGASERANADTLALFTWLYNSDPNLAVSGGRGASAAADYAANKTLTLPDFRGRTWAALDDLGNTAAGNLSSTYYGTSPIVLGAVGGNQNNALITANLPPYTPAGSISVDSLLTSVSTTLSGSPSTFSAVPLGQGTVSAQPYASGSAVGVYSAGSFSTIVYAANSTASLSFHGTAEGGATAAFRTVQPTILVSPYLKL